MSDFSIQSPMDFLKNRNYSANQTSVNIKDISVFLSEKGITASKKIIIFFLIIILLLEIIILGEQLSNSSLPKVDDKIIWGFEVRRFQKAKTTVDHLLA